MTPTKEDAAVTAEDDKRLTCDPGRPNREELAEIARRACCTNGAWIRHANALWEGGNS
jgi:hypothetical protein